MLRRAGLTLLALLALVPATAHAGQTVERLATLPNPSPVREHAGHVAWLEKDADGYHLVVRAPGAEPRRIPAGPHAAPFAFDLGSDTRGGAQVVYERDGDLYAFSLTRTTGERAIRNANTPDAVETAPTLWRGRLAFVRISSTGKPVVYTKTMTAPRSLASRRLPGVPSRGGRTSSRRVEALELHDRHLAQVVRYVQPPQTGHSETELRLVDLRGGVTQVARMSTGEGGQSYVGPSFAGGRLWWAMTCFGDPGGCRDRGLHRASLNPLRVERTTEGRGLDGLAATPDRVYVVDSVGTDEAGDEFPGITYAVEARTVEGWAAR